MTTPSSNKPTALLVIAPGFEDVEAVAVIDVLNRVGVELTIAAASGDGPVRAAYGSTLLPDAALAEITGNFDAIICPGGKKNAQALGTDDRVISLIREQNSRGDLVAAICAAPSHVLGAGAGILRGRRATGDPGFNEKLAASGAEVCDSPVCVDGNIPIVDTFSRN